MFIHDYTEKRENKHVSLSFDLVIIGGGMTGVCSAITAAREGIKVALIQDRPVLGGNASSEVRLWALGATSHMGNNNRWSREGGIIDEILIENLYKNKEGNPVLFDTILLDKVLGEDNISLFLNTIVYEVVKKDSRNIASVKALNPQNATTYIFEGTYFIDSSGDGFVAYSAGASYRMGAEDSSEYGELFAPDKDKYGELLGHSIFFYTKEMKNPVKYIPPKFALKDIEEKIPKVLNENYLNIKQHGCKYWWLEYGGRLNTIGDTEEIKYELWKIVYGIWDYIKNSGKYPETANQTLEWVGLIPGKRESRRFNGYYRLIQQDIIEQRKHFDAVAFGGWSIDLHPADAVYSKLDGCNQWHSKGIYQIPYRCYLSIDIDNLFLGGRIISTSHVAHGSSRVMCTSAHGGQVIGMAAALCIHKNRTPVEFIQKDNIKELQIALINMGHYIPNITTNDPDNLALSASITPSTTFKWGMMPGNGEYVQLIDSIAQLIPVKDTLPACSVFIKAEKAATLNIKLRASSKLGNFTPDVDLEEKIIHLLPGVNEVNFSFSTIFDKNQYVFICFMKNEHVFIQMMDYLFTGTLAVFNTVNLAVSNYGKQIPPKGLGVEEFEFWCPKRWPEHKNIAMSFTPPLDSFGIDHLYNSYYRPICSPNAWVGDLNDHQPCVTLKWEKAQSIRSLRLFFDTDANQALENNQMGHFYNAVPQCCKYFRIEDHSGNCLYEETNNYQTVCTVNFEKNIITNILYIKIKVSDKSILPSISGIICKSYYI